MAGDLTRNFNYAKYLRAKGRAMNPLSDEDRLAKEWGRTTPGLPAVGATTFVDTAEPYRYWREIVTEMRRIAHDTGRDRFYISANGMFPFVDFVSAGVYDSPEIAQNLFSLTKVTDGDTPYRMDGKQVGEGQPGPDAPPGRAGRAGGAGCRLPGRHVAGVPRSAVEQRRDFWRLYAAEAYANGLYFAFLLKAPKSGKTITRTSRSIRPPR